MVWLLVTDFIDLPKERCVLRCNVSRKKQSLHLVQMNVYNILFELRMSCILSSEKISLTDLEYSTSPYHFACALIGSLSSPLNDLHHRESIELQYFLNNIFTTTLTLSTNNNIRKCFCTS